MKRTKAHKEARLTAESKDLSLEKLIGKSILDGVFKKPGENDNYSLSWVLSRLKNNDMIVSGKLKKYSDSI